MTPEEIDAEWLMARARGEHYPHPDPERAASYERLEQALRELPFPKREGWEEAFWVMLAHEAYLGTSGKMGDSDEIVFDTDNKVYGGDIAPGRIVHLSFGPERAFTPKAMAVNPEDAPFFEVHEFKVGLYSQLPTEGPFKATDEIMAPYGDRCEPGYQIRLAVKNVSDVPRRFRATVTGSY